MDQSQDFRELQSQISRSLVDTTRTVGQLSVEDLSFQRSLDASVAASLDRHNLRLLRLAQNLVQSAVAGSEVDVPQLQEHEDMENNWQGVVDVVDSLLERADTSLDEYTGLIKRLSPTQKEQTPSPRAVSSRPGKSFRNLDLPKPQLQFRNGPSNHDTGSFKPLLKSKPNAIRPLTQSLVGFQNEAGQLQYMHPYEAEITSYSYPKAVYTHATPTMYKPFDSTSATFVDTPEAVRSMLAELKTASYIAVDLEHHDARSYVGIVCLMQISTREKDWIVDTLKPWREDLQILNEVFTDPRVLKVFHGAFMDIVWLQRDLGLYVVGLFDTFHAARALGYPQASLAYLLARFVHFDAAKQYQMADWRVRPLPDEMFDYARSDTHFLLYIYDHLRNELMNKAVNSSERDSPLFAVDSPLRAVLQNSKETALQTYERYIYDEPHGKGAGGWYSMLKKSPALFSKEQFAVFKAVHQWRDKIARENDDSLNYVMPKHVLFSIARAMPVDLPALLSVSHPISPPVRTKAKELLAVVKEAKEAGVDGPEMSSIFRSGPNKASRKTSPGIGKVNDVVPLDDRDLGSTSNGPSRVESLPIRSTLSKFWGPAFGSSLWEQRVAQDPINGGVRLALPLPQLTAEIFQAPGSAAVQSPGPSTVEPGARAEHPFIRDRRKPTNGHDGVFTVRQLGGSRTQKDSEQFAGIPPASALAIPDASNDALQAKANHEESVPGRLQRQAWPLAAGEGLDEHQASSMSHDARPDRQLQDMEVNKGAEQPSIHPFDYGQAESVLRAPHNDLDPAGIRKRFDPYSKATNAPRGARKARQERPGKTMTFTR